MGGHFDNFDSYGTEGDEPLYFAGPQDPEDIIWAGSDTEQSQQELDDKRLRYEKHAWRYLRGQPPVLQSASLRGPLDKNWTNPWRYRPRKHPDWWQPGSEDILFTRAKVMRWATDVGLGHLAPAEALARCKADAEALASARQVEPRDNSANPDDSESESDIGDHSEDLEDPLSQADDLGQSQSDPINSHRSHMRSSTRLLGQIQSCSTSGGPSNGGTIVTKRLANPQWLKGSYASKRARWDTPTATSSSPIPDFDGEPVRQRRHGSTGARTDGRAQIYTLRQRKLLQSHNVPLIESEQPRQKEPEEDLDELGDISVGTTFVSTVNFPCKFKASQSIPLSTTSGSDRSPLKERVITTPAHRSRKSKINSVEPGSSKLPRFSRSRPNRAAYNVKSLRDDSFVTEIAPSSRNVEKFEYRKGRKRSDNRNSADFGRDIHDQSNRSLNSPLKAMDSHLSEKTSSFVMVENDELSPESSSNKKISLANETRLGASSGADLPLIEASPIESMVETVKEISPICSNSDTGLEMLGDVDSPAEHSPRSSPLWQSSMKSQSEEQLPAVVELHHSESHAPDKTEDGLESTSIQDKDSPQSNGSPQTDLRNVLHEEIGDNLNSESTEEIIQSQIRSEMDLSIHTKGPYNGAAENEVRVSPKVLLEDRNSNSQNIDKIHYSSQSNPLQEISDAKDVAVIGYSVTKSDDIGNSTPSGSHPEQDTRQEYDLQSPWAAENIQQPSVVVFRGGGKPGTNINRNRDTPPEQRMVQDDSDWQRHERQETPENDGIIPFKKFMTPTPSPTRTRARPSLGGLPSTQVLVEEATNNPWAKKSGLRRSKKRVSFGLLPTGEKEDSEPENTTSVKGSRLSSPPPQTDDHLSEDDAVNDGSTVVDKPQKHFAAAKGVRRKLSQATNSPFAKGSPVIDAMAEAFIAADRETSVEQGRRASEDEPLSRHLKPISEMMSNISADSEGLSPVRSPLAFSIRTSSIGSRVDYDMAGDMDEFLLDAGGFLEEWSVETELKKTTEGKKTADTADGRKLFGDARRW
jgi:hypothetical protein